MSPEIVDDEGGSEVTDEVGQFALVPIWVLELGLTGGEIIVYVALRSFANASGKCWPSQKAIARRACLSPETVKKALAHFRELKILYTSNLYRQDGSIRGLNYFVPLAKGGQPPQGWGTDRPQGRSGDTGQEQTMEQTREHNKNSCPAELGERSEAGSPGADDLDLQAVPTASRDRQDGGRQVSTRALTSVPAPSSRPLVEAPEIAADSPTDAGRSNVTTLASRRRKTGDEGFDALWAIYPRDDDKRGAQTAYRTALKRPGVTHEVLMAGMERWLAADIEPRYWPYACRWLSHERYTETPEKRSSSSGRYFNPTDQSIYDEAF